MITSLKRLYYKWHDSLIPQSAISLSLKDEGIADSTAIPCTLFLFCKYDAKHMQGYLRTVYKLPSKFHHVKHSQRDIRLYYTVGEAEDKVKKNAQVQAWVNLNYATLVQYWHGELDAADMLLEHKLKPL